MKIRLTPELSYVIGLWSQKKTKEGIGVVGSKNLQEIFMKAIIDLGLTEPEKIQVKEDRVFFYHAKYGKFFQQIENEKLNRFKYLNDYSANYLAGVFDAAGGIDDEGRVFIVHPQPDLELLLLRLNFPVKKEKNKLILVRPKTFLFFVKNYLKFFKDHPILKIIKKSE